MASLFKLTLRDLLWLALLAAGLTMWGVQHRQTTSQVAEQRARSQWLLAPATGPSSAAAQRQAALQKFGKLTDQQLDTLLGSLASSSRGRTIRTSNLA